MFPIPPLKLAEGRLSANELTQLRIDLASVGLPLVDDRGADEKLTRLRQMYEPYVLALSRYFSFALPPWLPVQQASDNWRTSAWDRISAPPGDNNEVASTASFERELFGRERNGQGVTRVSTGLTLCPVLRHMDSFLLSGLPS
jgi:hypothetical protein